MRSGLMRLKLRPEFNHFKKANDPPNPKPLVLLPCSPLQLQSQLQEGCKTLEQLSPVLARLLVSGILCQSLSLCKLVEFLSLSRNSTFLLYARLLVETHRLSSSRDQGEVAFTVSSTTTFLWNTLIKGYSRTHFPQQGLIAYSKMIHKSSKPDNFTFPFVVKAASSVREGTQVHGHILSNGFDSNVFVVNTLLNMYAIYGDMKSAQRLFDLSSKLLDIVSWNTLIDGYAKSGAVDLAQQLFDRMPEKNEISWTAMISGYAKSGDLDVAQSMFDRLPICRNTVTWNSMISGFAKCGFSSLARKLFDEMPFRNIVSWNSMISSYAQNGELDLARSLFNEMPEKDVFSWSCMISGYAQNGRGRPALELFKEMQSQGHIRPNEVTLISVLSVCGHLAALDQGKWIHAYIERNGMALSDNLGASLIDMYAKCGCVKTSVEVFQGLEQKNVSTWNALIVGLAINGVAHGALEAFAEMQRLKTKPSNITFLGVLMACCHSGLADEGRRQFRSMSKIYGIQPEMKHYGCVVDMLGRAGLLEEAEEIVRSMPMKPDIMVLGALISACRIHGDLKIADRLRRDFLELKSQEAGCHVLFSNIYASAGRWADALDMRSILNLNQIRKKAGLSSVKSLEFEPQADVSIDGGQYHLTFVIFEAAFASNNSQHVPAVMWSQTNGNRSSRVVSSSQNPGAFRGQDIKERSSHCEACGKSAAFYVPSNSGIWTTRSYFRLHFPRHLCCLFRLHFGLPEVICLCWLLALWGMGCLSLPGWL